MATASRIPLDVYLRSSWEPDAEYVDGEIEERPMGEYDHADWQSAIQRFFLNHAAEWNLRVLPELRIQVAPTRFRVPDVTLLDRHQPLEQVITRPPIAVFEVLSPEDTTLRLKRKLEDYEAMGIRQIWVVDPERSTFERYQGRALVPHHRFEHPGMAFDLHEIESLLQR
jgi:Uma2 family endonuclease